MGHMVATILKMFFRHFLSSLRTTIQQVLACFAIHTRSARTNTTTILPYTHESATRSRTITASAMSTLLRTSMAHIPSATCLLFSRTCWAVTAVHSMHVLLVIVGYSARQHEIWSAARRQEHQLNFLENISEARLYQFSYLCIGFMLGGSLPRW